MYAEESLVVFAVVFSLGIQDSAPVVGFEVGLGVHIYLDFDTSTSLTNRESGDTSGSERTTDKLSNTGWAPLDNISSLQVELGSQNRVLDGAVRVDFSEGEGLVDGRALVTKSVNGSLLVNGNTDSKSTGNSRSGFSGRREVFDRDATAVLVVGRKHLSHAQ